MAPSAFFFKAGFFAKYVVKATRNLTRNFHVRHLIFTHRHQCAAVEQDVGRLQQRVAKKAVGARSLFDSLSIWSL